MHTKDFVIDQTCNWQAVEDILELFPDTNGVTAFALVVESVNAVDLPTFVIAT